MTLPVKWGARIGILRRIMATHKSAIKRHRQSLKKRAHNRSIKAEIRTIGKKVIAASKEEAVSLLKTLQSKIDKAGRKGIYHRRAAAKLVSSAMRALSK